MSQARDFADSFSAVSTGRRNMYINGAMQVSQRGTSFSSPSNGSYTIDRMKLAVLNMDNLAYTVSQSSTAPDGFANSFKIVATTAETAVAADERLAIGTNIEQQDVQHLKYGTSDAVSTTLSFWVRSNVTGTYAVFLYQPDDSRIISKTYTIDAANTWEKKTITFVGDTTGVIDDGSGTGIEIRWHLMAGTNFTDGTGDSWVAYADGEEAANMTADWGEDANDEWYITGIQWEVGNSASPFEHRSYGEELTLCQRYFLRFQRDGSNNLMFGRPGFSQTNAANRMGLDFPNVMRAAPTYSETDLYYWDGASVANLPTPSTTRMHKFSFDADYTVTGITTSRPLWFYFNSDSTHLSLDAEL